MVYEVVREVNLATQITIPSSQLKDDKRMYNSLSSVFLHGTWTIACEGAFGTAEGH